MTTDTTPDTTGRPPTFADLAAGVGLTPATVRTRLAGFGLGHVSDHGPLSPADASTLRACLDLAPAGTTPGETVL